MKKEKNNTISHKKILIPLIAREKIDEEFIEKAVKGTKEIVLLLVIDTNSLSQEFGFAASQIGQANKLLEETKKLILKEPKKIQEIIEWGDTVSKISHTAMLCNVDKIVIKKYSHQYWKEIIKKLKKEKTPIEMI